VTRRDVGHALRPNQDIARDLQEYGELIEQLVGWLAAVVFEVIRGSGSDRLAGTVSDQRRETSLDRDHRQFAKCFVTGPIVGRFDSVQQNNGATSGAPGLGIC
jgi:hypothetical protein